MTLARGRDLTQQHETYLAIKAGRIMRGWSQAQMAELMADKTGSDEWTENRITAVENGRKRITDEDLRNFAEVQGYDVSFYWYGPEPHRRGFRDISGAIPGYLNSAVELPGVPADNLNHDTTSCVDCLIDQNHLVTAEWLTPGGELPGQTRIVIDLTEAALTFAEAV